MVVWSRNGTFFSTVTDLGQPDQCSPAAPTYTRVAAEQNMILEALSTRIDEVLAEWELFLYCDIYKIPNSKPLATLLGLVMAQPFREKN